MADSLLLFEGGDALALSGAPESGADVGDWVDYHAKGGSMAALWMLRFERPQEYYDVMFEGEEAPDELWARIQIDVELLDSAPVADPDGRFARVAEVSVREPADLEGDDGIVRVTGDRFGSYRVRLLLDESRFPTRLKVQSWPAPVAPGRVVRGLLEPAPEPPDPASLLPEVPAGVAAADRIGNDVDGGAGARRLSGEVGVVHASIVLPRSPAWHSERFVRAWVATVNPDDTMPDYGTVNIDAGGSGVLWDTCAMRHEQQVDRITGWRGGMWSRLHPDDDPRRRRMYWWRWVHRVPPVDVRTWPRSTWLDPVLPRDTLLVVNLNRMPGNPVHTEIVIEHRDVPVEWVEDLTDWWKLQLAIFELIVEG